MPCFIGWSPSVVDGEALWNLPHVDTDSLTPPKARDLVVECFYFAHSETLARAKVKLGSTSTNEAALRSNIAGAVRLAFQESGGDYDRPTVASLRSAIEVLARKAESWGTSPDIIRHHAEQIQTMLARIAPQS